MGEKRPSGFTIEKDENGKEGFQSVRALGNWQSEGLSILTGEREFVFCHLWSDPPCVHLLLELAERGLACMRTGLLQL